MEIKEGTKLKVRHARKGAFDAVATADFDTEKDEWYPVATAEVVKGKSTMMEWVPGESIPCRNSLCTVEVA